MTGMRRAILTFLMVIMPLQTAWSMVAGVYGHGEDMAISSGLHAHGHHHDADHPDHDLAAAVGDESGHNEDGHHLSHCHHVFTYLQQESSFALGTLRPAGPPSLLSATFISHTPPLFERPPSSQL